MDGVISDTQSVCAAIESDMLQEHGIHISPSELTEQYAGTMSYDMFPAVFKQFNKTMPDIKPLAEERWKRIFKAVQGNIKAIPGTIACIKHLKKDATPIAVASASRMDFIALVLTELCILSDFDAIASAQEVPNGKPEPDVFLLAAKRLGIHPRYCIVIEDGIQGMIAAKKAGMRCIGLVQSDILDKNKYPADILVRSLAHIDLKNIK